MVPKLDFYIIDHGSFSKLHFEEVSLFQYPIVSEVVYTLYIYGVFSSYIQKHSPSTSDFFCPGPSASEKKNPRFQGYIVGYSPRRPHFDRSFSRNLIDIRMADRILCANFFLCYVR